MIQSLNKFIVSAHLSDGALKAVESSGFAMIQQKIGLKGLKLLADAYIVLGSAQVCYKEGAIIYIREELLHTQQWAKRILESESIKGKFIIVDPVNVEFIEML